MDQTAHDIMVKMLQTPRMLITCCAAKLCTPKVDSRDASGIESPCKGKEGWRLGDCVGQGKTTF